MGTISTDPIGFSAGDANLYRYVGNHGTYASDPSGLKEPYGTGNDVGLYATLAGTAGPSPSTRQFKWLHSPSVGQSKLISDWQPYLDSTQQSNAAFEQGGVSGWVEHKINEYRAWYSANHQRAADDHAARIAFRNEVEMDTLMGNGDLDYSYLVLNEDTLFYDRRAGSNWFSRMSRETMFLTTGMDIDQAVLPLMKGYVRSVGFEVVENDEYFLNHDSRWLFDGVVDTAFNPLTYAGPTATNRVLAAEGVFARSPQFIIGQRSRLDSPGAPSSTMTGGIHKVDGGGFADLDHAGGVLQKLGTDRIKVTDQGIGVVEKHLSRFSRPDGAPWGHNEVMLGRLKDISSGKLQASAKDLNFYAHELRESVRLRRLGSTSGPVNPSHYLNTHYATLREYGIPFENHGSYLYTEHALNMMLYK